MSVLPVERPGPMYSPFHSDLDDPDHPALNADEVRLAARPAAASQAREFTRVRLARWGLADLSDVCVLVVSEMTTNAITVTRARAGEAYPIVLRLRVTAEGLFAEVWDGCGGTPEPADPGEDDENGRGLRLVGMCTDEWGHYPAPGGGKVVFGRWRLPVSWRCPAFAPRWPRTPSHARTTRA
ncbi:ATP-binding protein [Streptosporangium sp. NPDC023615]|uniref:ATP-binding protein n=1 Tax=Streptosporangium sp. NPDC023615 TaxID=3154794 RepID=UPI00341CA499